MRIQNEDSSPTAIALAEADLEQAKQFEDDHDNDNYSDYVEDASVHAVDSYQSGWAVASINVKLSGHLVNGLRDFWKTQVAHLVFRAAAKPNYASASIQMQ